jgi:alkanesulfonate monooxygenase SsuD/methylene tetrahydromethanopterin reductase-like flavin-dependent oxidoreductase (luciferase family)
MNYRVLFQAGTSKSGMAFAAKHAEAVYIGGLVPSQAAYQIKAIREHMIAAGRDPTTIKFFAAINPIIGRTVEEAEAKFAEAKEHADVIGALAQFSGYTGIDMSVYPLDEELKLDTSNPKESAVQGFLGNFGDSQKDGDVWTPRKLGEKIAIGGFHPSPVGTPEMVADVMEQVSRFMLFVPMLLFLNLVPAGEMIRLSFDTDLSLVDRRSRRRRLQYGLHQQPWVI